MNTQTSLAWELIVQLMLPGEICAITSSARFAYGDVGLDSSIPPGQTQEYELALVEVGETLTLVDKSEQESREFLEQLKQRGNFYFKRQDLQHSLQVYKKFVCTPSGSLTCVF